MVNDPSINSEEFESVYEDKAIKAHLIDYTTGAIEGGQSVVLDTSRGEVFCAYNPCPNANAAVMWVSGARGGLDGPANGIYKDLSKDLVSNGLASLRLDYRYPGMSEECLVDASAGLAFLEKMGLTKIGIVGHSFGSAIALGLAPLNSNIRAVVSISSQLYGSHNVNKISNKPLLLIHGALDSHIAPYNAEIIFESANEPKELVILDQGDHSLSACRDELYELLQTWLEKTLVDNPR